MKGRRIVEGPNRTVLAGWVGVPAEALLDCATEKQLDSDTLTDVGITSVEGEASYLQ